MTAGDNGPAPRSWRDSVNAEDRRRSHAAGFGRSTGWGARSALLVIDMQYRTAGSTPRPFWEAIEEYPTSCGDSAWAAVRATVPLLDAFRRSGLSIIYPYVSPKVAGEGGRLAEKVPAIMDIAAKGYEFIAEVAPGPHDILVPKQHPSAFFATPLVSHLVSLKVDTLVVVGCTTSGCIRATVVDAFSYNFKVIIPEDCAYDRSDISHAVNLFDISQKYGDVVPSSEVVDRILGETDRPFENMQSERRVV